MGNDMEYAFVLVNARHKDREIEKAILELRQVEELHFVTGPMPYIVKLSAASNSGIGEAAKDISLVDGVESIQILVVLQAIEREPSDEKEALIRTAPRIDSKMPYIRFLKGVVEKGLERSPHLHSKMRIGDKPFIRVRGSIFRGLYHYYYSGKAWSRVELYIDRGNYQENKAIFDRLVASRDAIESEFGHSLNWARLDDKRACRISYIVKSGGYGDAEESWGGFQDEMVDSMIKLEAALRPRLLELKKQFS